MKKNITYSSIICILLFLLLGCVKNDSKDYIREDYNLFSNNSLIIDSTKNNEIRFENLTDTTLVLSKEGLKYSFSLDRLEDVLSEDVYDFFNISTLNYSELKLKKFNESAELKAKKDSISILKKNILKTIILYDSIPACGPHYDLKNGYFDFSSNLTYKKGSSMFNWTVDKFIFTQENEDIALYIEDSCSNIFLNVYFHIENIIDSDKGGNYIKRISFNPIKLILIDTAKNEKVSGASSFRNFINSDNYLNDIKKEKERKKKKENTNHKTNLRNDKQKIVFHYSMSDLVQYSGTNAVGKKTYYFNGKVEFYKNEIKAFKNNESDIYKIISVEKYHNRYLFKTINNLGDNCIIVIAKKDGKDLVTIHLVDKEYMIIFYISDGFTLDINMYNV